MDASREKFLEALFMLHFQALLKHGFPLIGHDKRFIDVVEDCVQESFIAANECYEQLKTHPNVAGWLRITLEHRIRQRMKKERRIANRNRAWDDASFKADVSDEDEFAGFLHNEECKQLVEQALSELKEKERDLVVQYYFKGKSVREISILHHTSQSVIKVQLHRIRKKIKRILENFVFLLTSLF